MNDLVLADRAADWRGLKAMVHDFISSPIARRVHSTVLDELVQWFHLKPRFRFTKATVNGWPGLLEQGPSSRRRMSENVVWQVFQRLVAAVRFRVSRP